MINLTNDDLKMVIHNVREPKNRVNIELFYIYIHWIRHLENTFDKSTIISIKCWTLWLPILSGYLWWIMRYQRFSHIHEDLHVSSKNEMLLHTIIWVVDGDRSIVDIMISRQIAFVWARVSCFHATSFIY